MGNVGLKEEGFHFRWVVETDRGVSHFFTVAFSEAVQFLESHRLVVNDILGNRYHVSNVQILDRRSRNLLEIII